MRIRHQGGLEVRQVKVEGTTKAEDVKDLYHSVSGKTLVEYIFTTYGVYIAFGMLLNI